MTGDRAAKQEESASSAGEAEGENQPQESQLPLKPVRIEASESFKASEPQGEPERKIAQGDSSDSSRSESDDPHERQWLRVRQRLLDEFGKDVFASWFGRLKLKEISSGVAIHSVPTAFLRNWIGAQYKERILCAWREENPQVLRVDFTLRSALRDAPVASPDSFERGSSARAAAGEGMRRIHSGALSASRIAADKTGLLAGSPLDPKHDFDSFVEGNSNRMAFAAAREAVGCAPGAIRFNPLFIHGPVGQGKTHLLQAMAREAIRSGKRALYLTAERFMWGFASAIREQSAIPLKRALREVDLLLIDDMQFMQGKAIQAEFCHLLNDLIDGARQVAAAGDRQPEELESLDERIRSRLKGGATLRIEPPDYETRRRIVEMRLRAAQLEHPDLHVPSEILDYVARRVTASGRDIEGAFNQLLIQIRFSGGDPLDPASLDKTLDHLVRDTEARRVRIEDIQRAVSRRFNVSRNDLLSNRRTRMIVRPRQIAMYLAKTMTPRSLPEIGRRFGGRDHTTVLHAVRKIEELSAADRQMAKDIESLKRAILD